MKSLPVCLLRPLLCLLLSSLSLMAQEPAPPSVPPDQSVKAVPHRATIGLVLEGGGALGLAHVGVLRWLEEHRIPVDYVAGTSMGGLVGGLYSTGMSGEDVYQFVQTIDWNGVLRNETPYRARAFRRKEDRRDYPNDLEFGLKHGVNFPSGFNSGHQVGLILDRIALPYSELASFDELPTPFRCVATDLVTGKATVFDRGSLAQALRATMSLPAIFSPVRGDGQIYVDGGLLENLPVDVVRAMGADVVIAVHLETAPLNPKVGMSAFGVLERSISVVVAANELASMQRADVLVWAHTAAFTATDYQAGDKIIALGESGAEERRQVLSRFALDESEWKQFVARREQRRRPIPVPQFVQVTGTAPEIAQGIAKSFQENVGKPVDFSRLDWDLTNVTGLGRFERAGFQMERRDGQQGLLIRADEKDYAPPTVNPLFIIDGSDYKNTRFEIGARITLMDLGGFGSELRTDLIAGSVYGIGSEYYHPMNLLSHFFVAPRVFARAEPFDVYLESTRIATYREHNYGGGFDFGFAISRFSELRFGYQTGYESLKREIGQPELPNFSGREGFSRIRHVIDHTDDPIIPRTGYRAESNFSFYDSNPGATEHFPAAEIRSGVFQRLSRPSSIFLLASGGSTFGREETGIPVFSLGGPTRLGAYGVNELLSNQYFLFQPGYIHRVTSLPPLLGKNVYLITEYEIGKAYGQLAEADSRLPMDGNLAVLFQTLIGPVLVGGAVGDRGHHKFYFQLGRFF
jgi:NTE family protein